MQPELQPNANANSEIPRFGLSFDESGVSDQYKYLKDFNNYENYRKNNILLHVEVLGKFRLYDVPKIKLVPSFKEHEKNYYDSNCDNEREMYKIAFMIRFWEKVVNGFQFNPLTVILAI